MNWLAVINALLGLSGSIASHNISRNGAMKGYFPLEDRTAVEDVVIFIAMWIALTASILWIWINLPWWLSIAMMIACVIGTNLLILALPRSGFRPMPWGRPAFWAISVIAIVGTALPYYLSYR